MANTAANDSVGMDKADLKRLLRIARKDPVHMAFALGGDGKPIIMLDKRKQPRALERGIKEGAPDARNHRFGSVAIDPDDPKLAIFTINKAASGMARRLVIALKGTGYQKVQILLDDGTSVEAAEGEAEEDQDEQEDGRHEAADEGDAETTDHRDAPDDASGQAAGPAASDPAPAAGPAGSDPTPAAGQDDATAPAQPDAATLTQTLTGLVKQMMAVIAKDPSQKAALAELATDAQASLKRGDLAQAAAGIEVLRQAIDAASGGTAATAGAAAPDPQQPAASTGADPAQASSASPPAAQDGAPAQDAAGLLGELTAVVKQLMPIVAADQTQRDAVKGIVAQAQASLKSGDLDTASKHLDTLRAMLDGGSVPAADAAPASASAAPSAAAAGAPGNGAAATYAKSRLVWTAARTKVDGDIAKLHDEFMAVFKDHAKADDIGAAFRQRVGSVMDKLDAGLADKLDALANNTDPSQHAKLVQEAKQLVQNYQTYLANEPLIATLDTNPFTPLAIGKTMTATLSALGKALG
jgi:hypothetical protein